MVQQCPTAHKNLRLENISELPDYQFWIDVGMVHPHSRSRLNTLFNWVEQLDIAELAAQGNRQTNAFVEMASPPVVSHQKVKETKYNTSRAKQALSGHCTLASLLTPSIISDRCLGGTSPTTIRVVEMITHAYHKTILRPSTSRMGSPSSTRRPGFAPASKTALCALTLMNAGKLSTDLSTNRQKMIRSVKNQPP